jgi:hypothetical protein
VIIIRYFKGNNRRGARTDYVKLKEDDGFIPVGGVSWFEDQVETNNKAEASIIN